MKYKKSFSNLIGEVTDSCLGKMLDKKKNKGEYAPYLANVNVRWGSFELSNLPQMRFEADEQERYGIKYGDIIMCEGGEPGRCAIWRDEIPGMKIQKALHRIRTKEQLNNVYLYYWFLNEGRKGALDSYFTGTTIKHLPGEKLKSIPITYPDMTTQRHIAKILSTLDDKIHLNNTINKNLEQQAQALYQRMFIDSPCAEWREGTLSDIAEVSSGKRPPMKSTVRTNETAFPIVGAADVMGFTNSFNHNDKILIIGRVGTHGIVQRINSPCWTSDNTLVITSNYYEHVYQILKRIDYHSLNRGSTQPLITQSDINKVPVLLPDNDALIEYETLAGTLMSEHEANVIENTKLSEIRDTLLPRLMSGEIDVSEIDF